jgi:trigger factor
VDISLKEITSVDKELTLKATRGDLQEKFDKALKKYRGQISMPGFRPGHVPLSIVKKRFGNEIEIEEINKYVQEVFETKVIDEYDPVGETQMIDFQWENDELEVVFKIGAKPNIELKEIAKIKVNKMVHDVTDDEVEDEIKRTLERAGGWEDVDEAASKNVRVVVDVESINHGDIDEDQTLDLRDEGSADFLNALKGHKTGEVVEMTIPHGDHEDHLKILIKKVQKPIKVELNEEFIKKSSMNEATTEDEFRSYLKSKIQQYYDQSSDEMFKTEVVAAMVDAHNFDVPEVFIEQVKSGFVQQLSQQLSGKMPETFDEADYRNEMTERATQEAKWHFISQILQEKFEDIEIKPEDIDEFIAHEAVSYGATADQMKGYYAQNPGMLEMLRTSIRENKVLERLQDEVKIIELSKDAYIKEQEKKKKATK